jgi:hypothetical protein
VVVYAVQQGERNVYCSSAHCIAALLKTGWRLSDASQLTTLVRELVGARTGVAHEPSDHLQ